VSGVVRAFEGVTPTLGEGAFVAETAAVIGDVVLGPGSSIWYGSVLRGDVAPIRIGARSNVQDLSMVHGTTGLSSTTLGEEVTVGHRVILHGCTIGDRVLVGMGSIVLDLAVIETDVVLGAGSLVTPRSRLESGWLYLGSPAKKVRRLNDADRAMIEEGWRAYVQLSGRHS
jgi:carbonic anhydrase/acetyltransferase-like protein (isoleucine patch superfamily)